MSELLYKYRPLNGMRAISNLMSIAGGLFIIFYFFRDRPDTERLSYVIGFILILPTFLLLKDIYLDLIVGQRVEIYPEGLIYYLKYNDYVEISRKDITLSTKRENDSYILEFTVRGKLMKLSLSGLNSKKLAHAIGRIRDYKGEGEEVLIQREPENQYSDLNPNLEDYVVKSHFVHHPPKYLYYMFLAMMCVSGLGLTASLLLLSIGVLEPESVGLIPFSGVLLILTGIGFYAQTKEKLLFDHQTFTHIKPFGRSQSARLNDIKYVFIKLNNVSMFRIRLLDEHGNVHLSFQDYPTAFRKRDFLGTLYKSGVKRLYEYEYNQIVKKL